MKTKKNTNEAAGDTTKTTVKRPRSGEWTPIVKQIPIPGTDETTDLEFYRVEFSGETIEVRKNREGAKKAGAWIKAIKNRGEESLRIDKIRRELEELSEKASTQEMTARLYQASRVLAGDAPVGA